MKRWIQAVSWGGALLWVVASAWAYILPSKQILEFMIDQFGAARTLVVFQKTVLYDPALEGGMREFDETLYFRYPGAFRSEVHGTELDKIRVVNLGAALIVVDGKIMGETEGGFDHFKDPMLYRQTDLLADALLQLGVDVETVSLGRFKDRIAYVIGARYPDDTVPQLWVDKEDFSPLRLIVQAGTDLPFQEIEYSDYRSLAKGIRFPGRILFYEQGALVKMQVLDAFEVNREIPDQKFDVTHLKGTYGPVDSRPSEPDEPSELDEVKRSIQDFRKIFE